MRICSVKCISNFIIFFLFLFQFPFIVDLLYAFQTGGKLYLILEYLSGRSKSLLWCLIFVIYHYNILYFKDAVLCDTVLCSYMTFLLCTCPYKIIQILEMHVSCIFVMSAEFFVLIRNYWIDKETIVCDLFYFPTIAILLAVFLFHIKNKHFTHSGNTKICNNSSDRYSFFHINQNWTFNFQYLYGQNHLTFIYFIYYCTQGRKSFI